LVFDARGRFVKSWGREFKGGAHGLHRAVEGDQEFLYLCDTHRRVVIKTNLDGDEIWRVGAATCGDVYSDSKKFCPTNVATAPDGTVFVADGYGSSFIHCFSSDGLYEGTFGGAGSAPGQMNCPHGLIVDRRGDKPTLLVADRGNRRLQRFDLMGRHLGFVHDELRAPCHFGERNGTLLIPDLESRVTLFDENNKLIAHLGDGGHYKGVRDQAREAFKAGQFVAPHSACFDSAGNIFVVEWVEVGRITKLRKLS
jgi:sugar lactone lactonase YvrE